MFKVGHLTENWNLRKNIYKNITGPNPVSSWHLCSDFYPTIFEGEIAHYSSGEYWLHNVIPSRSVTKFNDLYRPPSSLCNC